MKKTCIISLICLCIDQIIKFFLYRFLDIGSSIILIKNFFNITLVYNEGAAFSILLSQRVLLILISIFVLIFLYFYLKKEKNMDKYEYIFYGILTGGILGNLTDRLFRGAVIDYLDFNIFGYAFPIFNFADMCIVCSVILIIIKSIRDDKNGISSK
ncbi:MAG: signal peptidase II [Bacilli bacterium]|nr:signal peptidase II [Bacilli bacterium]